MPAEMPGTFDIELRDVRFFARHGIFEQERIVGNEFLVDLRITIPAPAAHLDLCLDNTVSYADLFEIVKERMQTPTPLLESVASLIADDIRFRWKFVISGSIAITKTSPPIPGMSGRACVTYNF